MKAGPDRHKHVTSNVNEGLKLLPLEDNFTALFSKAHTEKAQVSFRISLLFSFFSFKLLLFSYQSSFCVFSRFSFARNSLQSKSLFISFENQLNRPIAM